MIAPTIDTHVHLADPAFAYDLPGVMARAQASGVVGFVVPATDAASSRDGIALAHAESALHPAVGIHPLGTSAASDEDWREIQRLAEQPPVVAIGETGLDYYRSTDRDLQSVWFARHLRLADSHGLPVIIHNRSADRDLLDVLHGWQVRYPRSTPILHCSGGNPEMIEAGLACGAYFGIGGNVTYPNAEGVRRAARSIPEESLLIETDAPFLTPVPHRGKRNEPEFLELIAQAVAEVRGLSVGVLRTITAANARRAFRLAGGGA